MKPLRIAVIPGDGIGPEVVAQGLKVLRATLGSEGLRTEVFPWGCQYYLDTGRMMPEDGLARLREFDAIYLGAVGDPRVPDAVSLPGLLLAIRRGFDQYVNLRPVRLLPGVPTPLAGRGPVDIDMLFVRENVEGEYAGAGGRLYRGVGEGVADEGEVALQTGVFTRRGIGRVMEYAFALAVRTGKPLCSVSKANALNHAFTLWDEVFREKAADPRFAGAGTGAGAGEGVRAETLLVDAAALQMVRNPGRFGVVVASNLFGDILTDLGAALAGGLGFAAGANLNPEGRYPSMFEPVHGSAPDIAGRGVANPIAAIWAAAMLLEHVGRGEAARRVMAAIEAVARQPRYWTPDVAEAAGVAAGTGTAGGARATTEQVGDAVAEVVARGGGGEA